MQYNNKSAIRTPIINKVITLNKALVEAGRKLPKGKKGANVVMHVDIRHNYFAPVLKSGALLFMYAMRQLKGKDYVKRALEVVEEIQANCYLIHLLGGWNERKCAEFDLLCDEIASHLHAIASAAKASQNR